MSRRAVDELRRLYALHRNRRDLFRSLLDTCLLIALVCLPSVALGDEMRHNPETVDLLKDYVIQLHRYGHLDSVMTEVPAADGLTTAYRFQGGRRAVQLSAEIRDKVSSFLQQSDDFTIQFSLRQPPNSVGTILSFGSEHNQSLEVEISGWRNELRLRIFDGRRHRRPHVEVFRTPPTADGDSGSSRQLADDRWHTVSIGLSSTATGDGFYARVHVDCVPFAGRRVDGVRLPWTHSPDFNGLSYLWIGQRRATDSVFKGALEYVRLTASTAALQIQCPHAIVDCPTCTEFYRMGKMLYELQSVVQQLSAKLTAAERRIVELEACECRRQCPGPTPDGAPWYRDGDVVSQPDTCTQCVCRSGSVVCESQRCPPLSCKHPFYADDQCCPVCRKSCLFHGIQYEHGEAVTPRRCHTCTCQDGKMVCERQQRRFCPKLPCRRRDQILAPGNCCKHCRDTDFCALPGRRCHDNATCVNLSTRHACVCDTGFRGDGKRCHDIDECKAVGGLHGHHCHGIAECVNIAGSYSCRCPAGYEHIDPYTCLEVDECQKTDDGGKTGPCDVNADCVNSAGSYQCICRRGYTGDGLTCTPVCREPCVNGARCVDVDVCQCRQGYTGTSCETDVDECAEGMSLCDPVTTECVNVPGRYFCRCRHGFRLNVTSVDRVTGPPPRWSCVDADECSGWGSGHQCPAGTVCRNTVGSYHCVCQAGDRSCHDVTSCVVDGVSYSNGDTWQSAEEPCVVCRCQSGQSQCKRETCDCRGDWSVHRHGFSCCARHCRITCLHQQLGVAYHVNETWQYDCQQCQCTANGETDCWPLTCPPLPADCPRVVRDDGDCCPRCDRRGPACSSFRAALGAADEDAAVAAGCYFRGRLVPAYQSWHPDTADTCTVCQCVDGSVCCSYNQTCSSTSKSRDESASVHRQRYPLVAEPYPTRPVTALEGRHRGRRQRDSGRGLTERRRSTPDSRTGRAP